VTDVTSVSAAVAWGCHTIWTHLFASQTKCNR